MKVRLNEYGYYERIDIDIINEYYEMYSEKFYQGNVGNTSYSHDYTEREIRSFGRVAAKKELIINRRIKKDTQMSFLDIGCGEGYVLDYFHKKGWKTTGIDLSEYGLMAHNPHMRDCLLQGDCNILLEDMAKQKEKIDVVNCDLFLDCCIEPIKTLKNIKEIMNPDVGIIIVRVSNYLSPLHTKLLEKGILQADTWFDRVGNFSYFGKASLQNLLETLGYECIEWYGDTFVDFNLMNPLTDYYKIDGAGKICYQAMLDIEEVMEDISLERMVDLEKTMGDMGLGRHITCICRVGKNDVSE